MDVLAFLAALWASLSASVGGDAMALLVTVGFVAALAALYLGLNAFRKTEFYKQHRELMELVDDRITDLIFMVEFGDVDLAEFEKRSAERVAAGLSYVDPRMLYLIDKAQTWVNEKFHVKLDFEELLARAEHIFDEVSKSDTNNVNAPVNEE